MSAERKIPSPRPNADTQPYWDAAKNGELLLKYCNGCGKVYHYPRAICPLCGSDDTEWRKASGRGTIFSCSVLRRTEAPYCLAYVELDEGPIVMSNIVDTDLDAVRIGQPVRVVFKTSEDGHAVPMFALA